MLIPAVESSSTLAHKMLQAASSPPVSLVRVNDYLRNITRRGKIKIIV